LALGASTPVRDVRFVDLVAVVVRRRETRRRSNGAVDVDETAAVATDEVMVVVIDAILVAGG
jgi:ribosomal protein L14